MPTLTMIETLILIMTPVSFVQIIFSCIWVHLETALSVLANDSALCSGIGWGISHRGAPSLPPASQVDRPARQTLVALNKS